MKFSQTLNYKLINTYIQIFIKKFKTLNPKNTNLLWGVAGAAQPAVVVCGRGLWKVLPACRGEGLAHGGRGSCFLAHTEERRRRLVAQGLGWTLGDFERREESLRNGVDDNGNSVAAVMELQVTLNGEEECGDAEESEREGEKE